MRYTPHHGWHLVVAVLTIGLWLVSWISVCIGAWFRPWRCKVCGWHEPQLKPPGSSALAPKAAGTGPESSSGKA